MNVNNQPPAPWSNLPAVGPILRPAAAAAYLGYSRSRYYALVAAGRLPRPIKMGLGFNGAAGIPQAWLDAVLTARAANFGQA